MSNDNLFNPSAFWHQKLPSTAVMEAVTSLKTKNLRLEAPSTAVNFDQWTARIVEAAQSDEYVNVYEIANGVYTGRMWRIRLPKNQMPTKDTDGVLVVVDRQAGVVYEFWQFRLTTNGYTTTYGRLAEVNGSGWNGVRASGANWGAGIFTAKDFASGVIDHKVPVALKDTQMALGAVKPAYNQDGDAVGRYKGYNHMGDQIRLSPALVLTDYFNNPYTLMVGRSFQTYGGVIVDTAANMALYATPDVDPRIINQIRPDMPKMMSLMRNVKP